MKANKLVKFCARINSALVLDRFYASVAFVREALECSNVVELFRFFH